jgi:hypothetical protein
MADAESKRLANLNSKGTPFKKGVSGNLSGRAHRMFTLVTMALREKLASIDPKTKKTYAERIADIVINCALDPDPEVDKTRIMAISEILDRVEGKPKQQIDLNDVTSELRQRSDEDLMFHLEHGYFPEDEPLQRKRKELTQ